MTGFFLAEHAPLILAILGVLCVIVYVLADGLDLGVGLLLTATPQGAA